MLTSRRLVSGASLPERPVRARMGRVVVREDQAVVVETRAQGLRRLEEVVRDRRQGQNAADAFSGCKRRPPPCRHELRPGRGSWASPRPDDGPLGGSAAGSGLSPALPCATATAFA